MTSLIAERLRHRARSRGADPLLTYYDLNTGERTELSTTTFLNWVDKASNLLVDEYLLAPGDVVNVAVATYSPGHWVTFVVEMAGWQVGAVVAVNQPPAADELLVVGPDWDMDISGVQAVLACALHPLGLGFTTPLPAGVTDFSVEVRSQPDQYAPSPLQALAPAWVDPDRRLTQADLVHVGTLEINPTQAARRILVRPTDPWSTVRDGLLLALLTGGSTVVVVGSDQERLARIALTERTHHESPGS